MHSVSTQGGNKKHIRTYVRICHLGFSTHGTMSSCMWMLAMLSKSWVFQGHIQCICHMLQLSHLSQVHQVLQHKPDSWINLLRLNNVTHSVEVLLHQVLHKEKDTLNQLLTVSHAFPCTCTFPLSWSISFPMVDISLAKHSRDSPSEDDLSSLIIHSCMMASESSYGREREREMIEQDEESMPEEMRLGKHSDWNTVPNTPHSCFPYLELKQFSNESNVPKRPVTGSKVCFLKHVLSLFPLLILQQRSKQYYGMCPWTFHHTITTPIYGMMTNTFVIEIHIFTLL